MKTIYLDHAATTKIKDEVLTEMLPYLTQKYGNPSSVYLLGQESRSAIELARTRVLKAINANKNDKIIFTSGGSEADNTALKGIAKKHQAKGKHIITTPIEHSAILKTCQQLKAEGYDISFVNVDSYRYDKDERIRKVNSFRHNSNISYACK